MKILIQGSNILAVGNLTETADAITSSDAVYPKHVITGWQIVEATLPDDYAPGKYSYSAGVFTLKPVVVTAEQKAAANAIIMAKLAANDLKIVRALVDGDAARISAHKDSQAALRSQLSKE